jgi:hypothetical protein
MTTNNVHVISASKTIAAPPQRIYSILADYHEGHPSVLPRQFTSMTVEHGGAGAGTIIQFTMRLLGRTQRFRGFVSEPEPGRVLVETYETTGAVTSFIVDPATRIRTITRDHHLGCSRTRWTGRQNRAFPEHKTSAPYLRAGARAARETVHGSPETYLRKK